MPRTQPFLLDQRAAGVLLHPTSLPGPGGVGSLGREARRFADFLRASGQRWWQTLPISPPGPGWAPYSAPSAWAGAPLLIDPAALVEKGWLSEDNLPAPRGAREDRVNYPVVLRARMNSLRRAFERARAKRAVQARLAEFREQNASWLDDHALFEAIRGRLGGAPWAGWPRELRDRAPSALRSARRELAESIQFFEFVQWLFDQQWRDLRRYCHAQGVGLMGDVPIFVDYNSCDVWANRRLFQLDRDGRPLRISGVPPDFFSRTGQLWGHPLYDWRRHQREGFAWWIERFRSALERFDAVRIDHFLGFNRCWETPAGHRTALRGAWRATPGRALFSAAKRALGELPIVAEDLGLLTPEAAALRDAFGFPGMRVLQFGFGEGDRYHEPHRYPRNCVAYSGTHDNETLVGWRRGVARDRRRGRDGRTKRERVLAYTGGDGREPHWDLLRVLYASAADLVICPLQDPLGLDNRARMNTPATTRGNWVWRARASAITSELAHRLRDMARTFERCD